MQNEAIHNLAYALVQLVHNFGAILLLGGYMASILVSTPETMRKSSRLVLAGWAIQGFSGAAFGAASFYFFGRFPDIGDIGKLSLLIKVLCVMAGFILITWYVTREKILSEKSKSALWIISAALAVIALTAAAFLRWFS